MCGVVCYGLWRTLFFLPVLCTRLRQLIAAMFEEIMPLYIFGMGGEHKLGSEIHKPGQELLLSALYKRWRIFLILSPYLSLLTPPDTSSSYLTVSILSFLLENFSEVGGYIREEGVGNL